MPRPQAAKRLAPGPVPGAIYVPPTGGAKKSPAHSHSTSLRPGVLGLTEKELQNKQNIIIIPIMSKIVGYMVTWTTYGSAQHG